jgi:hypothetical protein
MSFGDTIVGILTKAGLQLASTDLRSFPATDRIGEELVQVRKLQRFSEYILAIFDPEAKESFIRSEQPDVRI